MHELSVAADILENVLTAAGVRSDAQVHSVRVALGELTGMDAEQVRFCFNSIAIGTPLEDAMLELETTPARVECSHCSYCGAPSYWEGALADVRVPTLQCPQCYRSVNVVEGHECVIKSVKWRYYENHPQAAD